MCSMDCCKNASPVITSAIFALETRGNNAAVVAKVNFDGQIVDGTYQLQRRHVRRAAPWLVAARWFNGQPHQPIADAEGSPPRPIVRERLGKPEALPTPPAAAAYGGKQDETRVRLYINTTASLQTHVGAQLTINGGLYFTRGEAFNAVSVISERQKLTLACLRC